MTMYMKMRDGSFAVMSPEGEAAVEEMRSLGARHRLRARRANLQHVDAVRAELGLLSRSQELRQNVRDLGARLSATMANLAAVFAPKAAEAARFADKTETLRKKLQS